MQLCRIYIGQLGDMKFKVVTMSWTCVMRNLSVSSVSAWVGATDVDFEPNLKATIKIKHFLDVF